MRLTGTPTKGRLSIILGITLAANAALFLVLLAAARPAPTTRLPFHSPQEAAFSPDGSTLAVSDRTAGEVVLLDPASGRTLRRVPMSEPGGLAWDGGGSRLYAAEGGGRAVVEIVAATGRVVRRLPVGARPTGLALVPKRGLLLAPCAAAHTVSVMDLARGKETARFSCPAEPSAIAVTAGEGLGVVTCLIPTGDATDPQNAAVVRLLDLRSLRPLADIRLPAGSSGVRGVAVSPDGRWAYIAHALGRSNVPTTQLDRGWVNTNAVTILDLPARRVYATVLLDYPHEGASDPWGAAVSKDGRTLWVALSGVHEVARLDLGRLHPMLEGRIPDDSPLLHPSAEYSLTASSAWADIRRDPTERAQLSSDLTALSAAGLLERIPLPGRGPRGLALSPDGKRLAVPLYFSGRIALLDMPTGRARTVSLGPSRPEDAARRGERMFHDASLCFQKWLSCATCHPDGRSDGLNWDLMNDGIGNPKSSKSLLLAHRTPPAMAHGIRASMEVAAMAGFRFIEFREPQPGEVEAVQAYIRSLRPQVSPYRLPGGALSPRARRGKVLFESPRTKCAACHPAPLYTNLRLYDVGTRGSLDTDGRFDTPTLVETWRTSPYMHDGRAVSMRDVLTRCNQGDRHGVTSHLTREQILDLAEYVLSL